MAEAHSSAWGRRARDLAAVLWPSFLAACVATMIVFGLFDPVRLAAISALPLPGSAIGGMTLGFFFFWGVTLAASALTAHLIRSARRRLQ